MNASRASKLCSRWLLSDSRRMCAGASMKPVPSALTARQLPFHVGNANANANARRHVSSFEGPSHRALLVDAAGTLLEPAQPVTQVYLEIGRKYGVSYSEKEILERYRDAYARPWCHSILRYVDDARPFWQYIVSEATGCSDPLYWEEVYTYYTTAEAWRVVDPQAGEAFAALRKAGVKIAVVSNFDTRLRPLLRALRCDHWFDALSISAEVQAEKPNPAIFLRACELLDVDPREAVHVGDDRRNDIWGARAAGCDAWLWGRGDEDVHSFREVAERMGVVVPESLQRGLNA